MTRLITAFAALGAAAVLYGSPLAQAADAGIYVGLGTGKALVEDNPSQAGGAKFDDTSTPYRAFIGYRLGFVPIFDFAAELGYRDLGKAEGSAGPLAASYRVKGPDASALVIFPFLGVDLFGKVGLMSYDLDKTIGGTTTGFSGTAPLYGVGVGFRVWRLGIRAEVERIDISDLKSQDVGMISATFRF